MSSAVDLVYNWTINQQAHSVPPNTRLQAPMAVPSLTQACRVIVGSLLANKDLMTNTIALWCTQGGGGYPYSQRLEIFEVLKCLFCQNIYTVVMENSAVEVGTIHYQCV